VSHKKRKSQPQKTSVVQVIAIVGVLALIAGVLILKARKPDANPADPTAGVMLPTAEVAVLTQPTPTPLPEARLEQLLAAGEPAFVFFHSNNCVQCIRMIKIVEQVYPDFSESVPLVDVNVYDANNENLLYRAGIRAIPTLIFIDRAGQAQGYVGVMEPEALREQLQALDRE
jgi:thiol:disulfide interchange protein